MKTTENTSMPSPSDRLPKGDGALHKAAMGAHHVVDKVAGAADEAARRAIPVIDRAAEYAHHTVDKTVTGVTPAAGGPLAPPDGPARAHQAPAWSATQKNRAGRTREDVAANPLPAWIIGG